MGGTSIFAGLHIVLCVDIVGVVACIDVDDDQVVVCVDLMGSFVIDHYIWYYCWLKMIWCPHV
jgi:hypothetical protein